MLAHAAERHRREWLRRDDFSDNDRCPCALMRTSTTRWGSCLLPLDGGLMYCPGAKCRWWAQRSTGSTLPIVSHEQPGRRDSPRDRGVDHGRR
jgi:hypothetical protein